MEQHNRNQRANSQGNANHVASLVEEKLSGCCTHRNSGGVFLLPELKCRWVSSHKLGLQRPLSDSSYFCQKLDLCIDLPADPPTLTKTVHSSCDDDRIFQLLRKAVANVVRFKSGILQFYSQL